MSKSEIVWQGEVVYGHFGNRDKARVWSDGHRYGVEFLGEDRAGDGHWYEDGRSADLREQAVARALLSLTLKDGS